MPKKRKKRIHPTQEMIESAMFLSRQESFGIPLANIAESIANGFDKDELAVLINLLTKLHAKKK